MKTAVRQTSIDCYHGINLNEQQKVILDAIEFFSESCIADVAAYLNWERSTVSGRMNDLKKLGLLIVVDKRKSKTTGIMSEFCRIKNFQETLF